MTSSQNLSFLIQSPGGHRVKTGIHEYPGLVIGVCNRISLMAIAQSDAGVEFSGAGKAIEILIDDMRSNLSIGSGINAATCLQESIENINDYLYQQQVAGQYSTWDVRTTLAAIQYWEGRIFYLSAPDISCLLFQQQHLIELGGGQQQTQALGDNSLHISQIPDQSVSQGDILLMAKSTDIEAIGHDYLAITLSRFNNNLEVALKQLNQKARRNGLDLSPCMILARIDLCPTSSGWMRRLRKR